MSKGAAARPPLTDDEIEALPYRPCVGLMVLNARHEVFVGQRLDFRSDAWQMPQGGIDPGETPLEAALRELGEETGIRRDRVALLAEGSDWIPYDLPRDLIPKLWKGRYRGQTQRWFAFRFLGEDAEIDIETEHPEFSRWEWSPRDDVLNRIVPFKRATYRRVLEDFSHVFG
ncbi:MAG: RNA pyrophosphohydrolase [Pseudomonadota bacterium]